MRQLVDVETLAERVCVLHRTLSSPLFGAVHLQNTLLSRVLLWCSSVNCFKTQTQNYRLCRLIGRANGQTGTAEGDGIGGVGGGTGGLVESMAASGE